MTEAVRAFTGSTRCVVAGVEEQRFWRRNAQGTDVNGDARRLQASEGRTPKAARDAMVPDFGFNLHNQNAAVRVGNSDRGVAIPPLAPAFNEVRDVHDEHDPDVHESLAHNGRRPPEPRFQATLIGASRTTTRTASRSRRRRGICTTRPPMRSCGGMPRRAS